MSRQGLSIAFALSDSEKGLNAREEGNEMKIKRIFLLAGMSLTAIAFAAPTVAQATVRLTDVNGNALAAGAAVTTTGANMKMTTAGGTEIACALATLHLEVVTNGANHVRLRQLGEATATGCVLDRHALGLGTLPVTLTDGTVGVGEGSIMTINTWGQGGMKATFVADIYTGVPHVIPAAKCHYEGNLFFDVTAPPNHDLLQVTPSVLTETGAAGCSPTGTIHGHFTFENAVGRVNVDFVATP